MRTNLNSAKDAIAKFIDGLWDEEIVAEICEFIRIPNKSPLFDPDWVAHGHMDRAVRHMCDWARARTSELSGVSVEVLRLADRTPLILIDVPGSSSDTALLYGHLDKQPEMDGWQMTTGPWDPKIVDEKLYGRGAADDGYAVYAAVAALLALERQSIPYPRCVILIEACEESGSYDLPAYVKHVRERLGQVTLVICLDSACATWDRLWLTTSLRGFVSALVRVQTLQHGVHSGDAAGVAPCAFRILRELLSRIEYEQNGHVLMSQLHVPIPAQAHSDIRSCADILGDELVRRVALIPGVEPMRDDPVELLLDRAWRPKMTVTGFEGLPAPKYAGTVQQPHVSAKLTFRLPPTMSATTAGHAIQQELTRDPPSGSSVEVQLGAMVNGWVATPLSMRMREAVETASRCAFGQSPAFIAEGGTVPFMGMLGEIFPDAEFVITGVLGPGANAHGPDEFLDIPTAKRVTRAVAEILATHATHE
jgi:acetylornithine deacetylase/succinyl-diaminopimelate desuccinylase-like protein